MRPDAILTSFVAPAGRFAPACQPKTSRAAAAVASNGGTSGAEITTTGGPMNRLHLFLLMLLLPAAAAATPLVVDTAWLAEHYRDPGVVVVDMSDDLQYRRFHVPGARHLPYGALNRRTRSGVSLSIGPAGVARVLGRLGISPSHHVVVYDDLGGLNAARLLWELERLGHARRSLVDGGLVKWILEGRPVTNDVPKFEPARYPAPARAAADTVAGLEAVRAATTTGGAVLLDVRSREEYAGHPRAPRTGHLPGARWFPWDEAVDFDRGFVVKPVETLRKRLAAAGLGDPGREVIVYCRSGHRATRAWLTLRRLGFGKVKVYDGSMLEYGQRKDLPLVRGMQPR